MLQCISRSRDNQTMKFGQLIKYKVANIFLQDHAENESGRLVPTFSLKKLYMRSRHLSFSIPW